MVSILIIEDDVSLRRLYEIIISLEGYQIFQSTGNGENAVKLFKTASEKPDLILIDHRMPIKTGLETAEELLEYDAKSKIIFASADSSIKDKALSIGAKSFLLKPFNSDVLIREIESILSLQDTIT